jgi:hypothetical protein
MRGHFKLGDRCDFVRRTLLKAAPAALAGSLLSSAQSVSPRQVPRPGDVIPGVPGDHDPPNGKQHPEILKQDYKSNLKDARELIDLTKKFELDLEESGPGVLSLGLLKKLDDIDKIAKRIRGRLRR